MRLTICLLALAAMVQFAGCQKSESAPAAEDSRDSATNRQGAAEAPVDLSARTNGGVAAWVHFAGATAMLSDTNNAARLNAIAALPATADWKSDFAHKLATTPFRAVRAKMDAKATDHADLLEPLVSNLLETESYLELSAGTNPVPSMLLAVKLDAVNASNWQTNLAQVLADWTGISVMPLNVESFSGWELKKHDDPNITRFLRAGDWVLFGWGEGDVPGMSELARRIRVSARPIEAPTENWLDAWVNGPAWKKWNPALVTMDAPRIRLSLSTRENTVRTKAVVDFDSPLDLKIEPWNMPTNLIRDSIVGFTAIRGIENWVSGLDFVRKVGIQPVPNQLFMWAMARVPFETYIATPAPNPETELADFGTRLIEDSNREYLNRGFGSLQWDPSNKYIQWVGLPPMMSPYLKPMSGTNGNFLLMALASGVMIPRMVSDDLWKELRSDANLLYYDWEVTGERLKFWRNMFFLYYVGTRQPLNLPTAPFSKWVDSVLPILSDNCATEVTLTQPNELTLVRKSVIGLNSLEIVLLNRWIDAPGFPLEGQPRKIEFPHKAPVTPAPLAPGK